LLALLALAVSAPYLYSVMPRGAGGQPLRLALQPLYVIGLIADILPVVLLSIPFMRWTGTRDEWRRLGTYGLREGDDAGNGGDEAPSPPGGILMGRLFGELSLSGSGIVAMWTFIVLGVALVTDLPTTNETKFAFLLFLPLAAFATGGINRMWRTRRGRVAAVTLVAAFTLPLNAVYFYHAFADDSTFEVPDDETAAYRFIERGTPADAVFIDSDDIVRIPVLGRRDLYWGNETYAFNWSYPVAEIRKRRAIRDAVFDYALTTEQIEALASLQRPVYVMVRGAQFDRYPLFQQMNEDPFYAGKFIAGEYAVFEMQGVGDTHPGGGGRSR
jgi:hypothetical protein